MNSTVVRALETNVIRFNEGETPTEPYLISIVFDGGSEEDRVKNTRLELGPHVNATVMIRYDANFGASGFFQTSLDLSLEEGAHLTLAIYSALPDIVRHDFSSHVKLAQSALLVWTEAIFDQGNGDYTNSVELSGQKSELDFAGAYGAAVSTVREHSLDERHVAPDTKSRVVLKSSLSDSAHLTFRGLILVEPGATGTDAFLSNRNLILDDGARADSLPQLRIETDDVSCSHGSTTGGPREDELFYLMSRGLDRKSSRSLMALGHLSSVLDRLPSVLLLEAENFAARLLGEEIES